jgi:hypothetical protein
MWSFEIRSVVEHATHAQAAGEFLVRVELARFGTFALTRRSSAAEIFSLRASCVQVCSMADIGRINEQIGASYQRNSRSERPVKIVPRGTTAHLHANRGQPSDWHR